MKVDSVVRKETVYVSIVVLILSALMEAVFLILHLWDLTVLFGNLLGGGIGILNFFLLGLSVQKAVTEDEKRAKEIMRTSHAVRYALIILLVVLAIAIPAAFNIFSTLISLLFSTVAVFLKTLTAKKNEPAAAPADAAPAAEPEGGEEA